MYGIALKKVVINCTEIWCEGMDSIWLARDKVQ